MSPALEKLSIRSDRQTRDAEPPMSLRPPASPSPPSLLAGERPSRLNPQYSTVSSRAGGHVPGGPLAAEEPALARLASYRSSRTTACALPPRHRPSGKQQNSGLRLYCLPVAATSRQGMVTGRIQNTDQRDTSRRTSRRDNQTSLEASSSHGSERAGPGVAAMSRHGTLTGDMMRRTFDCGDQLSPEGNRSRRSVSPEMSLGQAGLRDRSTVLLVVEGFSSARRLGRLDSRLSLGMVSRRGSERAGRGVAATLQHGMVIGSNLQAEQHDRTHHTSGRDDQSSTEGSSSHRSVSREMSLGRKRLQGCGTGRRVGAESSSSTRPLGRLDSRLSMGMVSRHGSERAGRGMAATSQHGTVIGSNPQAEQRDRTRRTSGRGDQSSLEGSNRRCSVLREMSLGRKRLQGCGTGRRVGAESSSSTRRLGRLDSRLSLGTVLRRGSERAGRGVATPEQSSSSNTMVTIHSRIRRNRDLKEQRLRRAEDDDEESTPWRRSMDASASSASLSSCKPRRTPKRVDSGSMYISSHNSNSLSGAAISYHSTSPTVLPESSASASYSPPPVSRPGIAPPLSWRGIAPPMPWRGIAPPMYAPQVTRSMRRRRRQEVLAKRVERLRMLKNKIATVFHHHYGHDQEGPSSRRIPGEQHHMSPWKYLGGMLHRAKGQDKKSTSRAVVSTPGKRPGGGNMHALFVALRQHLRAKRKAPASVNMWRKIANRSRVQAKKMHWWQQLKPRRGRGGVLAGSKLRRRIGR